MRDATGPAGNRREADGLGKSGVTRRGCGDGMRLLLAVLVVLGSAALMLGASALLVAVTGA